MQRRSLGVALGGCLAVTALLAGGPANASLAQPTIVSDNPANYTPNVEDDAVVGHTQVFALENSGDTIYAGGKFHSVSNASRTTYYTRNNLMSFSGTSGALTSFAPSVDGTVWAIRASGSSLYIGGYFYNVNGVARRGIAKINATTGVVDTAFNAHLNGGVTEIRLVNGRLLVGGTFSQRLLALNPDTGADTGYINVSIAGTVASNAGKIKVYRFAVDPAGTHLVAIGNFLTVDGQSRARAFMLNLGTGSASLASWYYQPLTNMCAANSLPAYLRDVDFSPDGSWFVIDSTGFVPQTGGIGRDLCDAAGRFETNISSPVRPTWINYTGGDTLHSVAVTGSVVYVQGHQRWLDNPYGRDTKGPGAVDRKGIGAIDPVTGKAISDWHPGKTRRIGGKDFLVTPQGLWVGSDGARFAGEFRKDIAFLPL